MTFIKTQRLAVEVSLFNRSPLPLPQRIKYEG